MVEGPPRGFFFFGRTARNALRSAAVLDGKWAEKAHFRLWRELEFMAAALQERLVALIEPLLARLGYELVELSVTPARGRGVLRIFIDKPEGIGLDDCERASHEVSALLDVEDPIATAYSLEVSSPGEDRVLRTRAHFERFVGSRVFVELTPREGRRRYTGMLRSVEGEGVALEVDRQIVNLPFREIGKARLAPL